MTIILFRYDSTLEMLGRLTLKNLLYRLHKNKTVSIILLAEEASIANI